MVHASGLEQTWNLYAGRYQSQRLPGSVCCRHRQFSKLEQGLIGNHHSIYKRRFVSPAAVLHACLL